MFVKTHPLARYNKALVALLGVVAALWGPDVSDAIVALLIAVGVYATPNA